jgi:hypothetical protein
LTDGEKGRTASVKTFLLLFSVEANTNLKKMLAKSGVMYLWEIQLLDHGERLNFFARYWVDVIGMRCPPQEVTRSRNDLSSENDLAVRKVYH